MGYAPMQPYGMQCRYPYPLSQSKTRYMLAQAHVGTCRHIQTHAHAADALDTSEKQCRMHEVSIAWA